MDAHASGVTGRRAYAVCHAVKASAAMKVSVALASGREIGMLVPRFAKRLTNAVERPTNRMMQLTQAIDGAADVPDVAEDGARVGDYLSAEEQVMLARARAGNPRALRQFYDTHQSQVRGHLYRLLGPDSEIDDLVQTIFARAFAALGTFKANSTLSTWLYRITTNTTHNLLRHRFRRNRVKSAFSWWLSGRAGTLHNNHADVRDEALRLLQHLAPDLREVFVFYHYEGLTLQEIAQILDKPLSTIGDRLTRARKRLHELVTASP
jgi:RNA polymerase sigma-70 factor (ECF subfamily)